MSANLLNFKEQFLIISLNKTKIKKKTLFTKTKNLHRLF